ncbi:MAG: hypothetical protein ACLQVI_24835 [Polyangiaceae bacterium]
MPFPPVGGASTALRTAEHYAAAGDHAWAAAHFRLAAILLARVGRDTASNRAWSKYRAHRRALREAAAPPAGAQRTEKGCRR